MLEETREEIAEYLGVSYKEIFFTSGGTEANYLAITGSCDCLKKYSGKKKVIYSGIEHPSVLHALKKVESQGFELCKVPVDRDGQPDLNLLDEALPGAVLATFMRINNETGIELPLDEIQQLCQKHGVRLHSDWVQSLGKAGPLGDGYCLASFSGHKVGALKGVGFLYQKLDLDLCPIFCGSQEKGKRGGTENLAGILSMKYAIRALKEGDGFSKVAALRDRFEEQIKERLDIVRVNGEGVKRSPNTSSITFQGIEGESLLFSLDLKKVCVSAGSACSSGAMKPSHVLTEMGFSADEARSTLRISFGRFNTEEQVDGLVDTICNIVERMSKKK